MILETQSLSLLEYVRQEISTFGASNVPAQDVHHQEESTCLEAAHLARYCRGLLRFSISAKLTIPQVCSSIFLIHIASSYGLQTSGNA